MSRACIRDFRNEIEGLWWKDFGTEPCSMSELKTMCANCVHTCVCADICEDQNVGIYSYSIYSYGLYKYDL